MVKFSYINIFNEHDRRMTRMYSVSAENKTLASFGLKSMKLAQRSPAFYVTLVVLVRLVFAVNWLECRNAAHNCATMFGFLYNKTLIRPPAVR